jgi:hypothetical protein
MMLPRKALEQLLMATLREQNINGKSQDQVAGCVLILSEGKVGTTSIVKDGKTSLSRFSFEVGKHEDESIPVPDIRRMLGVLKHHDKDYVKLTHDTGKVLVKSKNKQTTLTGGLDAKAFANSQYTLDEWSKQALKRAEQIIDGKTYMTLDKQVIPPFFTAEVDANELYSALQCDGMNGQKLNRYKFSIKNNQFFVTVGGAFKGLTEVHLGDYTMDDFEAVYEGGLENIAKHYSTKIKLRFFNFKDYGQGIRLLLAMENGDWVFQSGVL